MTTSHAISLQDLYLAVVRVGRFHYRAVAEELGASPKQTEGRWYFEKRRAGSEEQDWRCILFKFVEMYANEQLDVAQAEMEEIVRHAFKQVNEGRDDDAITQLYAIVEARARLDRPPKKRKIGKGSEHSSFSSQSGVESVSELAADVLRQFDDFFEFGK